MHVNNAHLFTGLFLKELSSRSRAVYTRALLAQTLFFWVARGRPAFTADHWRAEAAGCDPLPWPRLFAAATDSVDEHLPKAVRALYVYANHCRSPNDLYAPHLPGIPSDSALEPFLFTARQLVHMQTGRLQSTHHPDLPGAEQEFWNFDRFD
jgi:hypothetical protein